MKVYQHWDKLKTCMVGRSYPPEFYSWIKEPKARTAMERIAIETEEDYQELTKLLENKFGVKVIRPDTTSNHEKVFKYGKYFIPPMTPRDHAGRFGEKFYINASKYAHFINHSYKVIKDPSWPEVKTFQDIKNLDKNILDELINIHGVENPLDFRNDMSPFYNCLDENNIVYDLNHTQFRNSTADVCRVGKDLYYPNQHGHDPKEVNKFFGEEYRINFYNGHSHQDGCFCPVVPGLIFALNGYLEYEKTFPGWEVIELPNQSWSKVRPFLDLKQKNKGKWWIQGEENNDHLTECVEEWLGNWVGYVEETVFDVNMLVVDEKNVICNNYNKKVFDALERYDVTPHICNFRHRYFWDGGLHCITNDLDREGEMQDYFPERNQI